MNKDFIEFFIKGDFQCELLKKYYVQNKEFFLKRDLQNTSILYKLYENFFKKRTKEHYKLLVSLFEVFSFDISFTKNIILTKLIKNNQINMQNVHLICENYMNTFFKYCCYCKTFYCECLLRLIKLEYFDSYCIRILLISGISPVFSKKLYETNKEFFEKNIHSICINYKELKKNMPLKCDNCFKNYCECLVRNVDISLFDKNCVKILYQSKISVDFLENLCLKRTELFLEEKDPLIYYFCKSFAKEKKTVTACLTCLKKKCECYIRIFDYSLFDVDCMKILATSNISTDFLLDFAEKRKDFFDEKDLYGKKLINYFLNYEPNNCSFCLKTSNKIKNCYCLFKKLDINNFDKFSLDFLCKKKSFVNFHLKKCNDLFYKEKINKNNFSSKYYFIFDFLKEKASLIKNLPFYNKKFLQVFEIYLNNYENNLCELEKIKLNYKNFCCKLTSDFNINYFLLFDNFLKKMIEIYCNENLNYKSYIILDFIVFSLDLKDFSFVLEKKKTLKDYSYCNFAGKKKKRLLKNYYSLKIIGKKLRNYTIFMLFMFKNYKITQNIFHRLDKNLLLKIISFSYY